MNTIVQISLDLTSIPEAIDTAHLAIRAGVDWLEAGTPLIIAEGMNGVRALRSEFPGVPIVADLKTMDGGWLEAQLMAAAGATHVPGLVAAMGGEQATVAALEEMCTLPPRFNVGVYGQEIHEMSEMAALPFGQYMHNNQPVHNVLYLFAAAGRPDRTQYWVRRVLNEAYSANDFCGDEDTGSMSAWYVLSALGFYPLCPGKPEYTLGAPLFPHAVVHPGGGKRIVIEAPRNGPATPYSSSVSVNGAEWRSSIIEHGTLTRDARIQFDMQQSSPGGLRT
jgi:putative alpha-1,2-mannosidase